MVLQASSPPCSSSSWRLGANAVVRRAAARFETPSGVAPMEPADPVADVFAVPELLAHILGNLRLRDVPRLRAVCRAWCWAEFRVRCTRSEAARVQEMATQLICAGDERGLKAVLEQIGRATEERLARTVVLPLACERGRLEMVQWLAVRLGPANVANRARSAVRRIVYVRGHHELAKWLAARFGLVPTDAKGAFRGACVAGHLELAQWLADHFELAAADMDHELLDLVCWRGRLGVARWLADHFGLAPASASRTFRGACRAGHLEVSQWLAGHFRLTAKVARHLGFLHALCRVGRLEVLRWLADRFGLTAADFPDEAVQGAHAGGHLAVVEWVVARFTPAPLEFA